MEEKNTAALDSARDELTSRGFTGGPTQNWLGKLDCGNHGCITVRVDLPAGFPSELPKIYVDRKGLPYRIPHIEKDGKVCIAPDNGILIDVSRPEAILSQSLEKAVETISSGLSKTNQADFVKEFLAYWDDGLTEGVVSLCTADGPTRTIFWGQVPEWHGYKNTNCLISDDRDQGERWTESYGKKVQRLGDAIFVQLETSPLPPDFDEPYTVGNVLDIVRTHAGTESTKLFNTWLAEASLPATVIFSIPLPSNLGRGLIGIRFPRAYGAAAKEAIRGYKKIGKVPAARQLEFSMQHKAPRLFVSRLDKAYLVPRSGGSTEIDKFIVAVVGCGSVGSHAAELLARLGVGELRIVDVDILKPENIHRHSLGFNSIGLNKADAMRRSIGFRYPHIRVKSNSRKVQDVLKLQPNFLIEANLVIIALGDENLERALNQQMNKKPPRVHIWVEPLGLAQHALATGVIDGNGCYECLFESDADVGVVNRAALAATGQDFQRSFAGCGGTFSIFSAVDAGQAASLGTTLAVNILTGALTKNVLVSRRGDQPTFLQAGFKLSKRGELFNPRDVIETTDFIRQDCPLCKKA